MKHVIIPLLLFVACGASSQDSLRLIPASFNTEHDEYNAQDFGNGFAFCSNRRIEFHRQAIDIEYKSNTNLLYIEGKIKGLKELSEDLNTVENEGPFCFSADQKRIYFTGTIVSKRAKVNNWLGIFYSDLINGVWQEPVPLGINSDDGSFNVTHPCLNSDGKLLIFSSNMQGGFGNNDLYAFDVSATGVSIPYNLGPLVNTPDDELTPFISNNNILYYSSDHTEAGDFDVFSVPFDSEVLGEKNKLVSPINSDFDDLAFWLSPSQNDGTISSFRNEHDFDVYLFSGFQRSKHVEKKLVSSN
jgi:WD40-like Beta Propeller Repeat